MLPDLEQQKADGERAAYALEYLAPKFAAIEKEFVELMIGTNMHDQPSRDEITRTLKNLRRLREQVETDINNGRFAADLLQKMKKDLSYRDRIRGATGW